MISPVRSPMAWLAASALFGIIACPAAAESPVRVKVQGKGTDLGETPVVVALKADLPTGAYLLTPGAGSSRRSDASAGPGALT